MEQWGRYDHLKNKIEFLDNQYNGAEDLMEYVSVLTLSRGGKVFALQGQDIPNEEDVAAVLRY